MSLFKKMSHNVGQEGILDAPSSGSESNGQILFSAPKGEEKAIICKLVRDPRTGFDYIKTAHFQHRTGNGQKDYGLHPCRKSLKLGESLELNAYYNTRDAMNERLGELKKQNPSNYERAKNSDTKYRELEALKKTFSPRQGGYIFFVEPDSPNIRAMKLPQTGIEALFGKKGYKDKPDEPGVLQYLNAKKLALFVDQDPLMNRFGWVKIYKTGEGLDTRYHAVPLEEQVTRLDSDGNPETVVKPVEKKVHSKIYELTEDDLTSIPDPLKKELDSAWTEEETRNFVEVDGSIIGVPERFLRNSPQDSLESVESSGPSSSSLSTEDIPF